MRKFITAFGLFAMILQGVMAADIQDTEKTRKFAVEAITEIFFKRNPHAVDKYVAEQYLQHQPGLKSGRGPFREYLEKLFRAFPDYSGEIENVLVEGELVSFHFKWSGTHAGEFMGVRPTGKKIVRRTADVLRIKSGMIVEHWGIVDQTEMLLEFGILKTVKQK
jgi:predicted ester cyclase